MTERKLWLATLLTGFAFIGCSRPAPDAKPDVATAASVSVAASAAPAAIVPTGASKLRVIEADAEEGAASLIRTKRLEAKAEGRTLVVFVSATWCEPCKRFKAEIASGRLDARLGKTTLLAFDADRDGDRLGAAGYTFRFVPFVALPAANGSPAERFEAAGDGSEVWRPILTTLDRWQS